MKIFGKITERVIWWLTWLHLRRQLPEDMVGPFGWKGGGGQTIKMSNGEELQFVLIRPPISMWLLRQPVANPARERNIASPSHGLPSLMTWTLMLPIIAIAGLLLVWAFLILFAESNLPGLPPWSLFRAVGICSLFLLIPIYWGYEWNRRHYRLVVTSLMAYIITAKALTREFQLSRSPTKLIEETFVSSSGSEQPRFLGRLLGGWLHEFRDTGDLFMGTRVQAMADFLRFFPSISSIGEILHTIYGTAKGIDMSLQVAYRMHDEARLKGFAEEAGIPMAISGQTSAIERGIRQANAIIESWRAEHPGGKDLNLFDPRIIGFTLWNLETGERLEEAE